MTEALVFGVDPYGTPSLHETVWVAPGGVVVGNVTIGEHSSIWYHAVLRGDSDVIRVGARSNFQDGVAVHTAKGFPTVIGDDVSVGHNAVVHGATVENGCLIGMNATVLSGAVIGSESLVAAGAVVPENVVIPPRSLVAGVPARVRRELSDAEVAGLYENAANYLRYTVDHRAALATDGD